VEKDREKDQKAELEDGRKEEEEKDEKQEEEEVEI
jgi:hypothetical protein